LILIGSSSVYTKQHKYNLNIETVD